MFLSKVFYTVKKNDLVDVSFLTNVYLDSTMTVTPSRIINFSNSARDTCYSSNNLEKYDPRCRSWFKETYFQKRMVISAPFLYQSTSSVGFAISQRNNNTDGEMLSMMNWNIGVKNLKQKIFEQQDIYDESDPLEGYTVVFHLFNQTVIHHRYWDTESNDLTQWGEIEFNQTSQYKEEEKIQFKNNLDRVTSFAQKNKYSVERRTNLRDFYFKYSKNNTQYVALVYPIDIMSILSTVTKQIVSNKPMYVARVQKDNTQIIEDVTLDFLPFYNILMNCELALVIIWLILNVLHYSAVIYNSVDLQLLQLTYVIKNNIIRKKRKSKISINTQTTNNSKTQINHLLDQPKTMRSSNQLNQFNKDNVIYGDSFARQQTLDNIKQTPRIQFSSRVQTQTIPQENNFAQQALYQVNRDKSNSKNSNQSKIKSISNVSTQPQISLDQSSHSLSEQNSVYYIQNNKSNSKEVRKLEISDIDQSFFEMSVIVDSIKGIFRLLKLAKLNDQKGLNDISIIQFASALRIFVKVRNFSQQILCHKKIGNQYLKSQRYQEALQAYESALNIILMQFHLSTYPQFVEYIKDSKVQQENITYINDFVYIIRMLAVTQKEKFLHHQNQPIHSLIYQSMMNINICRQLLSLNKPHFPQYQFFLTEFIHTDILSHLDHYQAFEECNQLETQLQSFITKRNNDIEISSQQKKQKSQDIDNCKIIYQNVCLLKQKILIDNGEYYLSCLNITNLLESCDQLEEFSKFYCLDLLQTSFQQAHINYNTLIPYNESFTYELDKYNTQNLKITFIIEIEPNISNKQFEYFLLGLQKFINKNLRPNDEITFIVMNEEFTRVSAPYKNVNENFTFYCLKEIRRLFFNQEETNFFQKKIDLVNIIQYIIYQEKKDIFTNPLKQCSFYYRSDIQEKKYYLLFQFKQFNKDKLNERLLEYQEEIQYHLDQINYYSNNSVNIIHIHHSHMQEPENFCRTMRTIELPQLINVNNICRSMRAIPLVNVLSHEQIDNNNSITSTAQITPKRFNSLTNQSIPSRSRFNTRSKRNSSKLFNLNHDDSQCFKQSKNEQSGDYDITISQLFKNNKNFSYQKAKNFSKLTNHFNQIRYNKPTINTIYFL